MEREEGMPVVTLTAKGIESLRAGKARVDFWDTDVKGLHVRVSPNGERVFAIWYRVHQQPHRLNLGRWPGMTLKDARLRAMEVLTAAGKGVDAVAAKKAAAAEAQQRKLRGDRFQDLAEKCMGAITPEIRDRTAQEYRRILKANVYPRIGKVRPEEVTKGDIREVLRAVEKQGRIAANRTLAVVRRVFNWAASQDLVPASPVVGLKPSSEAPRVRIYTDDELRLIVKGLDGTRYEDVMRLILSTGTRITETVSAEWRDFDFNQALWIVPAEKRKTRRTRPSAHAVPLTDGVVRLLERRRAVLPDNCRWVFPAKRSGSFWRWGSAEDEAVREKTGVSDLRAHDLRRTMATRIRALGFPRETVDAILGHRESRLAQTYQLYDHMKEKAAALKAWERELTRIVSGRKRATRQLLPFARGAGA
jgi:integrase